MALLTPESVLGAARQVIGWGFTAAYIPAIVAVCALTPEERRTTVGPKLTRTWGLTMATIAGVQVSYTPAARAALDERVPRVLCFNHGSTLDVLTGAALLPEGGVLVVKSEMKKVPLLGIGCTAIGSIFLDRGDRDRAFASLEDAAQRIKTERLQVLIAPEGTRSTDGSLGKFKVGAFHLAALAGVPILPIVLHRHSALWPHGRLAPHRGEAIIDVLEPFHVRGLENDSLRDDAIELRRRYAEALAAGPLA